MKKTMTSIAEQCTKRELDPVKKAIKDLKEAYVKADKHLQIILEEKITDV